MVMHSASRTANERVSGLASVRSARSRSPGAQVDASAARRGSGPLLGGADDVPHQPDAVPDRAARRRAVLERRRALAGRGGRCRRPRPGRDGSDVLRVGGHARAGGGDGALDQRGGGVEDPGELGEPRLRPAERLRLRMTGRSRR